MSGRRGQASLDEQVEIGLAVIGRRAAGVSWKTLEQAYDRERTQLWRYVQTARNWMAFQKMQQQSSEMQHHRACAGEVAA